MKMNHKAKLSIFATKALEEILKESHENHKDIRLVMDVWVKAFNEYLREYPPGHVPLTPEQRFDYHKDRIEYQKAKCLEYIHQRSHGTRFD